MQKTIGGHNTRRARKQPEVGRTGARFGPSGRWTAEEEAATPEDPQEAPADDSPIGLTGARFGGARRRKRKDRDVEVPPPRPEQTAGADYDPLDDDALAASETPVDYSAHGHWEDDGWPQDQVDWSTPPESHSLVRPYAWTGGRTRAGADLALEALVHTTWHGPQPSWELRTITELCTTPRSVAEVAAALSVPLGVARVLVSDLAEARVVEIGQTAAEAPDLVMMHRVLAGLRRL